MDVVALGEKAQVWVIDNWLHLCSHEASHKFAVCKLAPNGKQFYIHLEVQFPFVVTTVLPFVFSQRPLPVAVLGLAMERSRLPVDAHLQLTPCEAKRPRSLNYNVQQNQPNAKSHGDGH